MLISLHHRKRIDLEVKNEVSIGREIAMDNSQGRLRCFVFCRLHNDYIFSQNYEMVLFLFYFSQPQSDCLMSVFIEIVFMQQETPGPTTGCQASVCAQTYVPDKLPDARDCFPLSYFALMNLFLAVGRNNCF
jgi:hypothetical protein